MRVSKAERDRLILDNLHLIYKIISRRFPYADFDDYVNQGILAFIKAIDKFDPGRGVKLTTYAYRIIENELLDYTMRSNVVANPVSRKVQNRIQYVGDDTWVIDNQQTADSAETTIIDDELMDRIKERVSPPEYAAIRMLQRGYKIREVRKRTGLTRGNIKKIYSKIADLL